MSGQDKPIIYEIDGDDRIVFLNDAWDESVQEHHLERLSTDLILGTPLLGHFANTTVRHLYDVLLRRIRGSAEEFALSYRCDTASSRREFRLHISPQPGGFLRFRSDLLAEKTREHLRFLEPDCARLKTTVTMCGWCNRICAPGWMEIEEGLQKLGLFNSEQMPQISHGICPECRERTFKGF